MRSLIIAVVALLCISAVRSSSIVAREKRHDEPVIIVDAGSHRRPFTPFLLGGVPMAAEDVVPEEPGRFGFTGFGSDFSRRLNAMLASLQNQFDSLWKRFYDRTDSMRPGTDHKGMFPPTYHNSTSTRKVVNGSIITVNETIDKHADNDSMSFFHVKVVHVRPESPVIDMEHSAEPEETPEHKTPEPPVIEPEIPEVPEVTEVRDREPLKPNLSSDKTNELEDNMP